MRIVHTADWHIGKTVSEHSMLEDQRYILAELISFLKECKADVLVIAGDLYDRSVPGADSVSFLDDVFTEIRTEVGIPILAIAGNHDSSARLSFASRLLQKEGLYLRGSAADAFDPVTLSDGEGPVDFYLLPYFRATDVRHLFPDAELRTEEDAYRAVIGKIIDDLGTDRRNVLISHGFISASGSASLEDASLSDEVSVGGDDFIRCPGLEQFDYVALGHLHAPQRSGSDTVRYSGSLLKYSIDEAQQSKKILTVDLSRQNTSVSEHVLPVLRDLRIIRGSFSEIIEAAGNDPRKEDYVFAEILQTEPEIDAMNRLRVCYPNALGLRYIRRLSDPVTGAKTVESLKKRSPETVFLDFYREISGEEISEEKKKIAHSVFETIIHTEGDER